MSDVQFEEENNYNQTTFASSKKSGFNLVQMVMKTGLASTEAQAQIILLVLVFVFLAVSVFLLFSSSPHATKPPPGVLEDMARRTVRH